MRTPPPTAAAAALARDWRRVRLVAGLAVVSLGLARFGNGRVLRLWDEPIQRAVASHRVSFLDEFFTEATKLGSATWLIPAAAIFALLALSRCRAVSAALVVAAAGSILMTTFLKALGGRPRPAIDPISFANGHAFPSGHVLKTVALWGLLPVVVGVFSRSRRLWVASIWLAWLVIAAVSASRIYLGVHWFSDVIGGLVAGGVVLLGADTLLRDMHRRAGVCNRPGSIEPTELGAIGRGPLDVHLGTEGDHQLGIDTVGPDLGRDAERLGPAGNFHPPGDERSGSDEGLGADERVVEHHGT